jgi:capsular exopolysaccharide synthesis family protein
MSRIREALKKAAEERSAHAETNSTEALMDVLNVGAADAPGAPLPPAAGQTKYVPQWEERNYQSLIAKCQRVHWEIKPRYSVFAPGGNHLVAERFRTLRSRLYQIAATQPLKRVLLSSSVPEEGKTFVASNLAQSIVRQSDRKVMLIDADLRASRLHLTLGTQGEPGLSDYLSGEKELTDVIQLGESDNFCFIPGGTFVANPSEILHSDKMKALLDYLGQVFDWVILDSPPTVAVHDASALGDMCDGVLFVIRAGGTDYELAEKAAAEFQEKNLLGVVLNRVDKSEGYGGYYYGYPYADQD